MKKRPEVLQIVLTERQLELMNRLMKKLNATKTDIIVECARMALDAD